MADMEKMEAMLSELAGQVKRMEMLYRASDERVTRLEAKIDGLVMAQHLTPITIRKETIVDQNQKVITGEAPSHSFINQGCDSETDELGHASMETQGEITEQPLDMNYGHLPVEEIQSKKITKRKWTDVSELCADMVEETVLIRGAAQVIRAKGKMVFLVVRQGMSTVQCVLAGTNESTEMIAFVAGLSKESLIDVQGIVALPKNPIKTTTQQVEIQVDKLYCVTAAESSFRLGLDDRLVPGLPLNIADAARSETEFEKAELAGEQLVRVGQDTRLNFRVLDLRTPANQAIFRVQFQVENIFREFLVSKGFVGIHTPKIIGGSSEGGAAIFKLDYKGQPACLAQSPQLHKQMAICGGFDKVFEIGPVFRAEDSFTHRHLCEFVGLDVEMRIKEHYSEVADVVDRLFVTMFEQLNKNCKMELDVINKQYPFEPLKYLPKTLRLTYDQGVQMLREAGTEIEKMGDLNTEAEKKLGRLVREKYNTDFYMLLRYPLAVRPFYTMPCYDDSSYSNSFDVFIRGEEIISGAQRVHIPDKLTSRAKSCGIDISTISTYIDSFRYGAAPHGGFGVGLERVVMLFCGLNNIRKTSLFPRDPHRLFP